MRALTIIIYSMNTEQSFRSTCATMLTKMIDTVPAGVQLGDEIKPIPFKISARYTIFNGTLVFDVAMRVRPSDSLSY